MFADPSTHGQLLASCLGVDSVRLDRSELEAAGREIREDVAAPWHHLAGAARAWYCQRVIVVGAESTGTTTLAQDVAERLQTVWVLEYGRKFTEEHGLEHNWMSRDFEEIALRQAADEDAAPRRSGPLLICDTDVLATAVWHERYVGSRSKSVEAIAAVRRPALYVLTWDDIPFIQNGMRDGEHIRGQMTAHFREVLDEVGVPWMEVRGTRPERVDHVARRLSDHFGGSWVAGRVGDIGVGT